MQIIPAIDLRDGKCVRLAQGDARRQTVYSSDPVAMAGRFVEAGARWLHVVDLDGAFSGTRRHTDIVREIVTATGMLVELGGGIRSLDDVRTCLDAGVSRVILGTAAHENPDLLRNAVAEFDDAIAVGIDARGGKAAVRGWTEQTETSVLELARRAVAADVKTLIYTDIAVDGMLAGPDLKTLALLLSELGVDIIASGGIATLEHVEQLLALSPRAPAGCIIGKALYTGSLNLEAAIALAGAGACSTAMSTRS